MMEGPDERAGRTVLVPLDGSRRAEQALPYAERLAAAAGARIDLASVVEPARGVDGDEVLGTPAVDRVEHRRAYLAVVSARLPEGVRGQVRVTTGRAADAVSRMAAGSWLVVLASHGEAGLRRWVLGSVTDRLVRELAGPVCVIRAIDEVTPPPPPVFRRVVVPLDGSGRAERALPLAVELARALGGTVLLLHAAPRPDETLRVRGQPVTDRWAAAMFEWGANYLDRVRARLAGEGVAVATAVGVGRPADVILEEVAARGDLVVMATHGRTGFTRWALGSIADKVVRAGEAPVVLVPMRGASGSK